MFLKVVIEKENDVNNVGLIGAGCSTASLPVAEISHHYNIPMVRINYAIKILHYM